MLFFYKLRMQMCDRLFYQLPAQLRRVTPLTWLVWAALLSDLAAPGYLVFHLGFTQFDVSAISREVTAVWEVARGENLD